MACAKQQGALTGSGSGQLVERAGGAGKSAAETAAGARRPDLPNYTLAEVEKRCKKGGQLWVTFKHGVYDVTDFVVGHPGGDKILLAAGGELEPFWELYAVHNSEHVYEQLEELRIGNVDPKDLARSMERKVDSNDPFANEPRRHPALTINSKKPFNAEPPLSLLVDNYITPGELFFVRNHLPVPEIKEKDHMLEVTGEGHKGVKLSVSSLKKKFKVHTVTSTMQCAGNRRSDMAQHKAVRGLSWGQAAISTATWSGVKLADVLADAGLNMDDFTDVIFEGADKDIEGVPYEASIPAATAFDPNKDVLLVFEMNGKPISRDHGYPLRVLVPGTVGARQVKWVTRITASKSECKGHWQQKDYKSFSPSVEAHNADWAKAPAIQEYPIQSAICEPQEGAVLEDAEEVTARGYAWSGGGRGIVRVDVSADGGKTWVEAELNQTSQRRHRQWAWTLWEATVPIPAELKGKGGEVALICKAVDTSHNCQPEKADGIWNMRGLIHNAWHRVNVTVPKE